MSQLLADIAADARGLSALETAAVASALAYLLLAIRQNIWCWLFAGASTAIYVYIFFDARLYMESALNGFYFAMAVYGWYSWQAGGDQGGELPVVRWSARRHAVAIVAIAALSGVSGLALAENTDADFPYLDSMTTWSALWATLLIARKVLENWWYWLAIDTVSVAVFWIKGLELTALLFVAYIILIPIGFLAWRRSMRPSLQAA